MTQDIMTGCPKEVGYYWVKMYQWDYQSKSQTKLADKWDIVEIVDSKDLGTGLYLYEFGNDFYTDIDKIYEYQKIEDINV
jgi:hypothetical protein